MAVTQFLIFCSKVKSIKGAVSVWMWITTDVPFFSELISKRMAVSNATPFDELIWTYSSVIPVILKLNHAAHFSINVINSPSTFNCFTFLKARILAKFSVCPRNSKSSLVVLFKNIFE